MPIRTLGVNAQYQEFHLYHPNSVLGWRKVHRVRFDQGEKKVAMGVWRRVVDDLGRHIGYQLLTPAAARVDLDIPSQPSSASISLREMQLNAEAVSRTAGLPERMRDERIASGRPGEDLAERVMRKVQVFPYVGSAKGDILRAWPKHEAVPAGA